MQLPIISFFVESIQLVEGKIVSWTEALKANGPEVRQFAKDTALVLLDMGESALVAADFVYRGAQGIAAAFQGVAALALGVSGAIFKVVQAGASLTDFLGLTSGAADEWAMNAKAAFESTGDLASKSWENLKQLAGGSDELHTASENLKKFRAEIEKIPADSMKDVDEKANDTAESTKKAADEAIDYKDELEKSKRYLDTATQGPQAGRA